MYIVVYGYDGSVLQEASGVDIHKAIRDLRSPEPDVDRIEEDPFA